MKILIIDPPTLHIKGSDNPRAYMPLGALSIASALKQKNYDVGIYDAKLSASISKNGNMIHFGDSWEKIEEKIKIFRPDVVGISNLFSSQWPHALKTAKLAKQVDRSIKTIIGGPHASVKPDDFLSDADVDFVVLGEGENTILKLLEHIHSSYDDLKAIKGIAFKEGERIVVNERQEFIAELDTLPFPDYDLLEMERYFFLQGKGFSSRPLAIKERAVSLFTSRGCPYNCVFCSIHLSMGKKFRAHSPEYVLHLIELFVNKYKVNFIHFEDDNFTFDRGRLEKILDGILKKGLKFSWGTPNGVRADTLNDEVLLAKMQKAGCTYLNIGIESGDQEILDKVIDKRLDLGVVKEIARKCHKLNLRLAAFFVTGFPEERRKNIKNTLDFALMLQRKYNVFPFISYATPLIGTRLYEKAHKEKCLTKDIDAMTLLLATHHQGESVIKTEDFTPKSMKRMVNNMYFLVMLDALLKSVLKPKLLIENIKIIIKSPYIIKRYILRY